MCKQPGLRQNNLKFFKRFLYFSDIFLVCSLIWIRLNTFAALIARFPRIARSLIWFFPTSPRIFSLVLISHPLSTDTRARCGAELRLHLTLHQNVSHIPDLPLQTQRNVVSKTLASARSAPSDTPACDLIFWRPLRDGMGCFLSPNEAASFASWFHYRRHSSSICIFHERVSPLRKSLWSFCCVCILFIYWCDVSGAYYS